MDNSKETENHRSKVRDWIVAAAAHGQSESSIKQSLRKTGYQEEQIKGFFPKKEYFKTITLKEIYYIVITVIFIGVFVFSNFISDYVSNINLVYAIIAVYALCIGILSSLMINKLNYNSSSFLLHRAIFFSAIIGICFSSISIITKYIDLIKLSEQLNLNYMFAAAFIAFNIPWLYFYFKKSEKFYEDLLLYVLPVGIYIILTIIFSYLLELGQVIP